MNTRGMNLYPECTPPDADDSRPEPVALDASKVPDLDAVERDWHATIEQRKSLERDSQRAFREGERIAPSAVVNSAEGSMLFPGLGPDLAAAVRAASRGEDFDQGQHHLHILPERLG